MNNPYLVVGNWKMNPITPAEAKKIANKAKKISISLKKTTVVICPPAVYLGLLIPRKQTENFYLGSQSVSIEPEKGSFTGEISATMIKNLGATYSIVGHSEQRERGDTDQIVAKKLINILDNGMNAIVCVGEKVRDADGSYMEHLKVQITNSFQDVPKKYAKNITLAYEPIWAIGAKEAMKSEDIYETSIFVKKIFSDIFGPELGVKARVLYGGSVNSQNSADIIRIGKVDGLLVGRESLNPPAFSDLLKAVDSI